MEAFSDRQTADALAIRGEIGTRTSVPDVLRMVLAAGQTGVLTFHRGRVAKHLYLYGGRVVYAQSTNPDERLGESLLVAGRITARQLAEAAGHLEPGRRLGAVLVELGHLEPDELTPAVEQQVRAIVMDLFHWDHGDYEFSGEQTDPEQVILHASTENLILEGIRQIRSWSLVLRGVGGIDRVLHPTGDTETLHRLELTPEEQEVLSQVNGRSTVEEIGAVSYLSSFETCRALWAFLVLGVARHGRPHEASGEHAKVELERQMQLSDLVERVNQMLNRVYQFLHGRRGDEADAFMNEALEQVSGPYASLFDGVTLSHYGRADFDQLLANVAAYPPDERRRLLLEGLNELIFAVQLVCRRRCGRDEEAVVSGIIQDGFRRLPR
jgi:hypothetical protein